MIVCQRTMSAATAGAAFDLVVIGGGIVGCATAREISLRHPTLKMALLEKENKLAAHQSGNNSGVIHAGIYYAPGSERAKLCVKGLDLTYAYCDKHNIPYKKCGKLIVAVDNAEIQNLDNLYKRALQNGVKDMEILGTEKIRQLEPHVRGVKAIWSPHTGIVDWGQVTRAYAKDFQNNGGQVLLGSQVVGFRAAAENAKHSTVLEHPVVVQRKNLPDILCKHVITCGGLFSDRLAAMSGCATLPKIVPFRGEYLLLKPHRRDLVKTNVYPVPDPRFPFLGVHFTPRMNGDVWLGPNAVLAFKREGYGYMDISFADTLDAITFRGMRKLMLKYMTFGIGEYYRGIWINAQVKQLQRYVPELRVQDVTRGPTGVRAQAMDAQGTLVEDFVFDRGVGSLASRFLHMRNAPSPGATSSLAIAQVVAAKAKEAFGFQ